MKRRIWVYAACLLCGCLLLGRQARSQSRVEFRTPGSDSIKVVDILNADSYRFKQVDSATSLTFLIGHVRIKQAKTLIDCDSLVMNPRVNLIECFGNVHINDNDSTNIYSDYMKYLVDQKKVHFDKRVRLTDGKGVLTTEDLDYDLNGKVGTYTHGGKIVSKESVLTSEQATYYETSKDVHFHNNVVLRDPQYDLSADSLLYNTQTQVSTFIDWTNIIFKDSTHRSVRTKTGFYDLHNKKAFFGKRPDIVDGSQRITGDSVDINDSTGISTAIGSAIYSDTAQKVTLTANYMITDKKNGTFLATQHPIMALQQEKEKDSIYITADTLFSGRLIDEEAAQRVMAIQDSLHRIFVDSLQKASADSLHRHALQDTLHQQDTLLAVPGSSQIVRDRSDSLRSGVIDSAGRLELDSLHKGSEAMAEDSTGEKAKDSLGLAVAGKTSSADTTKKPQAPPPLTERQKKRLEREQAKETARAEKVKIKAAADSVQKHIYELKVRNKEIADSLRQAKRDSIYQKNLADSALARNLRRAADSAGALARGDSSYLKAAIADRIRRTHIADSIRDVAAARKREADSISAPTKDSSIRYIRAYHRVRIFSDSLQAVSDSLYYSGRDSVFRLFYNPIAWSNNNYQINGDTMFVYTRDKKAKRLYVFENGLSINKVGRNFYNQLKGTTINAYFVKGEIDYVRAKGNAESIYYTQDDNKAYTGVNKAHADVIDMVFAPKPPDSTGKSNGRELNRVILRNDAEGSFIPMKKVNFDDMQLRGFRWQEAKRPKSKADLMHDPIPEKKAEDNFDEPKPPAPPEQKKPAVRTNVARI